MLFVIIGTIAVVLTTAASRTTSGAAGVPAPSADSRARAPQSRVSAPEHCLSARKAVPWYRFWTHSYQTARHADRLAGPSPFVKGHSCGFARYAATEWRDRAIAARDRYERWWESVGETIRRLNRGLEGTRWEGLGAVLEKHGRASGVSPYFIAAVAETESSIGAAACGAGGYNAWGLGNCTGIWNVPSFSSWEEAIGWYARYLASQWPGARTPYDFRGYAACDACWARIVSGHMSSRFGVAAVVTYP